MKITVRKFTAKDTKDWDDFVNQSNNGTIFHLRSFLSYHIDRKFIDHSLIFEKKGRIIALFSAAEIKNNGIKILHSHPGASYGGFIYHKLNFGESEGILESFEQYLLEQNFNETFFVSTPSIYSLDRDETLEYALLLGNYKPFEFYISSVITIYSDTEKNIKEIYRLKNRSRAYYEKIIQQNSITFKWENDFDTFYPILMENKKRHNAKPTHSLNELKKIDKILPGRLEILLMYTNKQAIGGSLIINVNNETGIIFYNMVDYDYLKLQPAVLQTMEAIRHAAKNNLHYLDFGVSQDPMAENPLTPSRSLIKFKEETGAFTIIRKAYKKTF